MPHDGRGDLVWVLMRYEWTAFLRRGFWVWPVLSYVLAVILITAAAVSPAHWAYRLLTPSLVLLTACFSWLIVSATPVSSWRITIVAVGGLERALLARWLTVLAAAVPALLTTWITSEFARQSVPGNHGLWWAGIWLNLIAAVFGASLGLVLATTVTERAGVPVPATAALAQATGFTIAGAVASLLPYTGVLGGFAFFLATVVVSLIAVTRQS